MGGVARSYDGNGNTLSGTSPGLTLSYDDRNRLAGVINGGVNTSYAINGRGERVGKTIAIFRPPTTTLFAYDEGGRLMGEYSGTGAMQAEYIYLDSIPVGVVKGGTLYYVETDHLGTPRQVVKPATNTAVWRWDFLVNTFGNSAPDEDPDGDAAAFVFGMRFPGQYFDAETDLRYNGARDYDPGVGRYVESDPIGLGAGPSTYAYVGGSPLMLTDREGLQAGWRKLPPSHYLKNCDADDWKEANARCSPNSAIRCKRNYIRKLGSFNGGNPLWDYQKADLQFECDDKSFCQRNPNTCTVVEVVGNVVIGIGAAVGGACLIATSPIWAG